MIENIKNIDMAFIYDFVARYTLSHSLSGQQIKQKWMGQVSYHLQERFASTGQCIFEQSDGKEVLRPPKLFRSTKMQTVWETAVSDGS